MIVRLSPTTPAELVDLDRLDRLHAECPGDPAEMRIASWCEVDDDGEHLWLDIAECRSIGARSPIENWSDEYDAMIAYATSKGWTDESGLRVRAHIERIESPTQP